MRSRARWRKKTSLDVRTRAQPNEENTMAKTRELLREALEDAALVGAKEIKEFLGTYRGKDPERLRRVQIAISAVGSYTRYQASHNNMVSMMLIAARQTGIGPDQTLSIAKSAGLLPDAAVIDIKAKNGTTGS
jgi:hypothetical protein